MKHTLRLILAAVLGLATTLALAWVPLLLEPGAGTTKPWTNAEFWIDDATAGHYQLRHTRFTDSVRMLHLVFMGAPNDQPYYKTSPPPPWTFMLTHAAEGQGSAAGRPWWSVDTLATGWPLRAFRGATYEPWLPPSPSVQGLQFIPNGRGGVKTVKAPSAPTSSLHIALLRFGGPGKDQYSLPLRPIPLGLTFNTLTFALAWLAFLTSVAQFRSWRRSRRGRCRTCNYDLRGLAPLSPCPECGRRPRTSHPRANTLPQ